MQEKGKENRISGRDGEKGVLALRRVSFEIDRHPSTDPDYRFEVF